MLTLRTIDNSRVGKTMPDSSAAVDIDGDGQVEVLSSMQDSDRHPEVLLYKRTGEGDWEPTVIGVVKEHKEEVEWLAVGKPFPGDSRYCVAVSVQHKKDGLVVFRLREQALDPWGSLECQDSTVYGAGPFPRFIRGRSHPERVPVLVIPLA